MLLFQAFLFSSYSAATVTLLAEMNCMGVDSSNCSAWLASKSGNQIASVRLGHLTLRVCSLPQAGICTLC